MKTLFLILALLLPALSCSAPLTPAETFLQGTWEHNGQLDQEFAYFIRWKFDKGRFEQAGYPPLGQTGRYRIKTESPTSVTLQLYDQDGTFGKDETEQSFTLDTKAGTISNGTMVFRRVETRGDQPAQSPGK